MHCATGCSGRKYAADQKLGREDGPADAGLTGCNQETREHLCVGLPQNWEQLLPLGGESRWLQHDLSAAPKQSGSRDAVGEPEAHGRDLTRLCKVAQAKHGRVRNGAFRIPSTLGW